MKLTPKTLNILKNFYTINSAIRFEPGNVLRTCSPTKTIMASATLDMSFDNKFCIYDISRFLNALGLFSEPDIKVGEKQLIIDGGASKVNYILAAENLIVTPSDNVIEMPDDPPGQFVLTNEDMQQLFKAMSILGLPEVAIVGDQKKLMLKGVDPEGKVQDGYSQDIGTTSRKFKAIIKLDNLKLFPGDYEVKIALVSGQKGPIPVANFVGKTESIEYFVAVSKDSEL